MDFDIQLIERLRKAKRIVFFTGAGASRESGVPTFREDDGSLWGKFDPLVYASVDGFDQTPALVWQWYEERRRQVFNLQPNPAHLVIAAWQKKAVVTVITQNIDGFHQRAGSRDVIEIHGSLTMDKCRRNGHRQLYSSERPAGVHPRCPVCDSLLRPDVVWFSEVIPEDEFSAALLHSANCDVFLSVGCSLEVFPAAGLPYNAKRYGSYVVQINPEQTGLDGVADANLQGSAGEVLPALWLAVWGERI